MFNACHSPSMKSGDLKSQTFEGFENSITLLLSMPIFEFCQFREEPEEIFLPISFGNRPGIISIDSGFLNFQRKRVQTNFTMATMDKVGQGQRKGQGKTKLSK
ncbi:hypothetical protein PoB_002045800 [Plakobranchus ocellatus]|uniref:Uncharacterized protein n=1 Tax=Plakobranchus ocellatus TaxID=259542 RepID=A0AAV3ZHK2_9GAST|nr:hypothetical protein PoB_002045800 [Plakobranchus ocellatus]